MKNIQDIMTLIETGTSTIIPEDELRKKMESGEKLRIKLGMDPTSPDLHLGHAIVLKKLRQFQDLGHEIIVLIGDFTARIGDPTGRSKTRPALTKEQIARNTQTYFEQVGKIIDQQKLTVRYNSEWLDQLNSKDIVELCAKVTVAQLTHREDFANRIKNNLPISFHELLYPLFQGYDSVALQADVELGGTDQTFNLLMGRHLQEHFDQEPQVIITTPLLEGLAGQEKMSKSLGNAIGLVEPADQAFGKLMSISDTLMWHYLELLVGKDQSEISTLQEMVAYGSMHPMALKKSMAHDIIAQFWSPKEADTAQETFEALFQKHDYSKAQPVSLPPELENPAWIVDILKHLQVASSTSQARRLIEGNAVSIDGQLITDFRAKIDHTRGMIIKAGKHHIYKIN